MLRIPPVEMTVKWMLRIAAVEMTGREEQELQRRDIIIRVRDIEPMQSHYCKVFEIDLAVAVYVAGDDGLADRFAEV
jgi:hypothetical protein